MLYKLNNFFVHDYDNVYENINNSMPVDYQSALDYIKSYHNLCDNDDINVYLNSYFLTTSIMVIAPFNYFDTNNNDIPTYKSKRKRSSSISDITPDLIVFLKPVYHNNIQYYFIIHMDINNSENSK